MFVYCITNKVNGKKYVGLTTLTLKERFRSHVSSAMSHNVQNKCTALAAAICKYGPANFAIETLEACDTKEQLSKFERTWIEKLSTISPHGYNIRTGGETGYKQSVASNEKNRLAHLGRKPSEESRQKMILANTGKKNGFYGKQHSADTKAKIGQANSGRCPSIEAREKMAVASARTYELKRDKLIAANANTYRLIDPLGQERIITNLTQFCRDNNLRVNSMFRIIAGTRKSYRGWKVTQSLEYRS